MLNRRGANMRGQHTITECTNCWIVDGKYEVPKKQRSKRYKAFSWFEDFAFDLLHFYG